MTQRNADLSGIAVEHLLFEGGAPLRLKPEDKARLKVLFLAKHALAGGQFDKTDGTHSMYHDEIKSCLEGLGLDVVASNSYEALFHSKIDQNYVFTLFNRGGFRNSEILASCLCEYLGVPYMGAAPSMRGFADDKHLVKTMYRDQGIPTPQWQIYRTANQSAPTPDFKAERYVVKPNNSSASYGLAQGTDWEELKPQVLALLAENHDVIVEEYVPGIDVSVPVVGAGKPWILYPMMNPATEGEFVVTYEQKRGFASVPPIEFFKDHAKYPALVDYTKRINAMVWPYDYARFDYRIDPTGKVWGFEFNVSCNLGAKRAICQSAKLLGYEQSDIVESVIANSLERQRFIFEAALEGRKIRYKT